MQNPGDDLASPSATGCLQKNPNGDCYPETNLGWGARKGSIPGNRIPNFHFLGRVNGDPTTKTASTGDLAVTQLADLYDPKGAKVRIIRIVVGALWCGPCNQEAEALVANKVADELGPQGVVLVTALIEGATAGIPATTSDLDTWTAKHLPNWTQVLDGQNKLGPFWVQDAIPENITIDARSMEILAKEAGYNPNVKTELQTWLAWTQNNPPQ